MADLEGVRVTHDRRLQPPEEIAAAICWLLSDDASGVTGEAMNVSAGQTMV